MKVKTTSTTGSILSAQIAQTCTNLIQKTTYVTKKERERETIVSCFLFGRWWWWSKAADAPGASIFVIINSTQTSIGSQPANQPTKASPLPPPSPPPPPPPPAPADRFSWRQTGAIWPANMRQPLAAAVGACICVFLAGNLQARGRSDWRAPNACNFVPMKTFHSFNWWRWKARASNRIEFKCFKQSKLMQFMGTCATVCANVIKRLSLQSAGRLKAPKCICTKGS